MRKTTTQEGKTSCTSTRQDFAHISAKIPLARASNTTNPNNHRHPIHPDLEMEDSPPALYLSLQGILGLLRCQCLCLLQWPLHVFHCEGKTNLECVTTPVQVNCSILPPASLNVEPQGDNYKHWAKRRNTGHLFFCCRRSQLEFPISTVKCHPFTTSWRRAGSPVVREKELFQGKAYCLKRHRRVQRLKDPLRLSEFPRALGFYFELNIWLPCSLQ